MMDFAVKYETARDRVLAALQGLTWTSWRELDRVGGNRYSARVRELKRQGYKIASTADPSGDGKRYRLLNLVPGLPERKYVKIYFEETDADALTRNEVTPAAAAAATKALRIFQANKHKL